MYVDNGLRPERSSDVNVQAVVPSNQDYRSNLDNQQSSLENAIERPLAIARERWEMFREEPDEKRIQLFESRKQTHCRLINKLQTFSRGVGKLWAASGSRIPPQTQFGVDWALIKLPAHRQTLNIVSLHIVYPYRANRTTLISDIASYICRIPSSWCA